MDSLDENGVEPKCSYDCKVEILPTHKDDTDMLAAIRKGLGLGYRQFQIYGGLGGRLDHTIANIQCLLFLHNRGAKGIPLWKTLHVTAAGQWEGHVPSN